MIRNIIILDINNVIFNTLILTENITNSNLRYGSFNVLLEYIDI